MGNTASNEANQGQGSAAGAGHGGASTATAHISALNPLARPRSHGGAVSQAHEHGSQGRSTPSWSRHGSLRRGSTTQATSQQALQSVSARNSLFGSHTPANTTPRAGRQRADSASFTAPTSPVSSSHHHAGTPSQRERSATASASPTLGRPGNRGERHSSASASLGAASLFRKTSKLHRQKSIDLQDAEGSDLRERDPPSAQRSPHQQVQPISSTAVSAGGLAPTAALPAAAIVSPNISPSVATDLGQASSGATSYLSHPGSSAAAAAAAGRAAPRAMPSASNSGQHRAFGRGVAAIFNTAGPSLASTAMASLASGNGNLSPGAEEGGSSAADDAGVGSGTSTDPLGRQVTAALPSYLKIPTLIPSRQSQPLVPTLSAPSSPTTSSAPGSGHVTPGSSGWSAVAASGTGAGRATSAVLAEEVVIPPGEASRVSSPTSEELPLPASTVQVSRERLEDELASQPAPPLATEPQSQVAVGSDESPSGAPPAGTGDDVPSSERGSVSLSRTPTPTQRSHAAKALTPARKEPILAAAEDALRGRVHIATGVASGVTTPVMPIPPGLTSAPPSATTPAMAGQASKQSKDPQSSSTLSVDTVAASNVPTSSALASGQKTPTADTSRESGQGSTTPKSRQPPSTLTPYYYRDAQGPVSLMPIVLNWRGGGKEVFVTGTFANEWRSKILLKRGLSSSGQGSGHVSGGPGSRKSTGSSKEEHSVVLHLPPGTHRLKFIVDDRWRVSRELPTASDGDGNLVNYLEIPNVGPAHPGPLSAPGEDLLDDESRERERRRERDVERIKEAERAGKRRPPSRSSAGGASQRPATADTALSLDGSSEGGPAGSASTQASDANSRDDDLGPDAAQMSRRRRAILDLQEEARRAELIQRGQLEEVFGVDEEALRAAETWVQEVPEIALQAQALEERYRDQLEAEEQGGPPVQDPPPAIPLPPSLPRQLEKVILNSSPANPALAPPGGLVDDNSILPAPNHVVLNHMTASAIKGGVLAVGTTTRYKRKYVTTVFYRPVKM
ncbi:unnamed protein product [Parajaminaea phylloscopi]